MAVLPLAAGLAMLAIREPSIGQWDRAPIRRLLNERVGDDPNAVSEDPPMRLGGRFARVIGSGTALRALLCGASAGIAIWGLNTYLWQFLRDRWGMTVEARDLLLRTVALGAVPFVVVAAVRLEKAFRASPRHLMWALTFVGPITAGALAIFIIAPWWALSVIMLLVFTAGAGVLLLAATFLLLSLVDPRFRDAAAVILVAAALFGGTAAAQLSGIVGQRFGIGWALLIPGFMMLAWSSLGPAQVLIDHDLDSVIGRQVEVAELTARTRLGQRLPLLVCKHIDFSYGQVQVLFNVSFSVSEGEIVALLGTNGAGKTTLLRTISGVAAPSAGSVHFLGEDVTFSGADQRVAMGISQIPGGRAVFGALTVADNLRAYGYTYGRRRSDLNQAIEEAFAGLPKLYERRNQLAQTLSGGEQQMLGVAKAYVIKPRVLLIDELSLGLAPIIVSELLEMVSRINEAGTAVVLVEQSVNVALSLAKHAYFMEKGEIRFDGPTDELLQRPELLRSVFLKGATVGLMGARLMIATFQVHPDVILLGIVTGMTYGVLGAGLVLIYRANRIINFAYGEIGALGAAVLGAAVSKWHFPYWIAFIMALAAAALVGVACEVVVVRRFRAAPLVLTAIVTLGLGTILDSFSAIVSSTVGAGITYPQPAGFPSFFVGALLMTPAYTAMLILTPPFVIAVAIFLRRGRLGIAMRAAASNHDAALMSGMRAPRLSSLAWAMGGVMAAFTAILVLPTRGFSGGQFLGPGLLLRGLFCGVIAGMTSLPITLVAGIALGVVEQILLLNYPSEGMVDGFILAIIVVALLLQRTRSGRSEDKSVWATVQAFTPLPAAVPQGSVHPRSPLGGLRPGPDGGHPDTRARERRPGPGLHHHRRLQRGGHVGGHHHRPRRPAVARAVRPGRPGGGGVLAGAIPRPAVPGGHHLPRSPRAWSSP